MLLVGPNTIFLRYIDQVLPSLGEEDVQPRLGREHGIPAVGLLRLGEDLCGPLAETVDQPRVELETPTRTGDRDGRRDASLSLAQARRTALAARPAIAVDPPRILAFGDSLTEGAVSLVPFVMLDAAETYPAKLQQMLLQRYPSQTIVVSNEGLGGEETSGGARRLPSVLAAREPEVMLLLEGVNNINGLSTSEQASNIDTMIREAQRQNVDVIIATLMPVLPRWRHYQPGHTPSQIQALNTQIFALAERRNLGAPVDLFAIFSANPDLVGSDGLHPTAQGQTRIAEAFRDEIVRRYDRPPTVR